LVNEFFTFEKTRRASHDRRERECTKDSLQQLMINPTHDGGVKWGAARSKLIESLGKDYLLNLFARGRHQAAVDHTLELLVQAARGVPALEPYIGSLVMLDTDRHGHGGVLAMLKALDDVYVSDDADEPLKIYHAERMGDDSHLGFLIRLSTKRPPGVDLDAVPMQWASQIKAELRYDAASRATPRQQIIHGIHNRISNQPMKAVTFSDLVEWLRGDTDGNFQLPPDTAEPDGRFRDQDTHITDDDPTSSDVMLTREIDALSSQLDGLMAGFTKLTLSN
jgi:hypothetical protein